MSKVRDDLLKQIDKTVQRNKQLAKQVSREATIAKCVSDFFIELEKVKKLSSSDTFVSLALNHLTIRLRKLDRKCYVLFKDPTQGDPVVEIVWSSKYMQDNNCEEVLVFDTSSAFFQSAIEDQDL